MKKSVLVTGATGFIGRHVILPLLQKEFTLHATFSQNKPITEYDVTWHAVNLHDKTAVENVLSEINPSHLLHFAWFAKPKEYWTSPKNLVWLESSLHLLKAFIKVKGERAVFIGSCAEYNWEDGLCSEYSTSCVPDTLYGKTKHDLYNLSNRISKNHDLSFAWARLFFLFGAHEHPERLIPAAIKNFLKQKKFNILNGNQIRDFMCVAEAAAAIAALLDSNVTGPVNIASGRSITIYDLIMTIANQLQCIDLIDCEFPEKIQYPVVTADVTRLRDEVKWQPKYSLESALGETIAWWQGQQ